MSRRTSRTREVFSSWPEARWKRRLNCPFFSLPSCSSSWSAVCERISSGFMDELHPSQQALDDARLDRKLGGAELEGLAGGRIRYTVELEHDAARLHARPPQLRRTLA